MSGSNKEPRYFLQFSGDGRLLGFTDGSAMCDETNPQIAKELELVSAEIYESALKEIERLEKALEYYAEGFHFSYDGGEEEPQNPSGEPGNIHCGKGDFTFEDGTFAQMALDGKDVNWEEE